MNALNDIKNRIIALNGKDKIFNGINLSYNEQSVQRGKPLQYIKLTIDLLFAIHGKSIVEIGCMRSPLTHPISEMHPECCNDGHSTFLWCTTNAKVTSVDISKKAVKAARFSCKDFHNCKIIQDDALNFLGKFKGSIDLLYLDAWDVSPDTPYAENHVLAYLKAKDKLSKTNIISIDDTDIGGGGKGRLLIPVLKADGYQILVQGRQTIALKEAL